MTDAIRVLVIDDHAIVREGIRSLLGAHGGLAVVAETGDARDAVRLYESCLAEVVVMDLELRSGCGPNALCALLRHDANARVVVFSDRSDEERVFNAIASGARGYVLKSDEPQQLIAAIRAVHAGRRYLTNEASDRLAAYVPGTALTCREKQVLELLAHGEKNHAIAAHLGVCNETIKGHIKNILAKLDARSRTEAVSKAIRRGMVRLDRLD